MPTATPPAPAAPGPTPLNYDRSAAFFLHSHPRDPRHDHAYDRSGTCFRATAALFTPIIEPVAIPYEGTTLPGYLYRADTTGVPRPTLIMHSGFDGTAEELHLGGALAAVEPGCTVLTFDGPGQPGPRHHQGMVFRPDRENVTTPVVDFAETIPSFQVNPRRWRRRPWQRSHRPVCKSTQSRRARPSTGVMTGTRP
ncbi:alpha/beta hydrolase family protein [Kitasatospora sp. NPDC088346]|uniref:alpha/beta hydrolase family protein n=1 Tax=Kitasatospora sp. NPDC088346 TaxID=3364073 RepID=UPI00382AE73D